MSQVDGYEIFACPTCGSNLYDPASGCSGCGAKSGGGNQSTEVPSTNINAKAGKPVSDYQPDEWVRLMLYRSSGSARERENNIYKSLVSELAQELAGIVMPEKARIIIDRMIALGAHSERRGAKAKADREAAQAEEKRLGAARKARAAATPHFSTLSADATVRCHLCGKSFPKKKFKRHLKQRHSIVWNP